MTETVGAPAYQQVAEALRQRISQGHLAVGDAIPSTRELCIEFSVSATVVRGAVAELRTEGLLRGQPGKAVYVIATPEAVQSKGVQLDDLAEQIGDIRASLGELAERVNEGLAGTSIQELRDEVSQLRRLVGQLHGELINLYGRTGQPMGHGSTADRSTTDDTASRRATGSSR